MKHMKRPRPEHTSAFIKGLVKKKMDDAKPESLQGKEGMYFVRESYSLKIVAIKALCLSLAILISGFMQKGGKDSSGYSLFLNVLVPHYLYFLRLSKISLHVNQ